MLLLTFFVCIYLYFPLLIGGDAIKQPSECLFDRRVLDWSGRAPDGVAVINGLPGSIKIDFRDPDEYNVYDSISNDRMPMFAKAILDLRVASSSSSNALTLENVDFLSDLVSTPVVFTS